MKTYELYGVRSDCDDPAKITTRVSRTETCFKPFHRKIGIAGMFQPIAKSPPHIHQAMGYGGLSILLSGLSEGSHLSDDYALMAGAVNATGAASPAARSKGKL